MANQIVQLTDDSNNNIFPIAGGMASNSVTTNMLQDGAVNVAKLGNFTGNNAIYTTPNISPVSDSPDDWVIALGGPFDENTPGRGDGGYFLTEYNESGCFANQLDRWGWLETIVSGTHEVYQRWTTRSRGLVHYRMGNINGWWNDASDPGAFRALLDSPSFFSANVAVGIPDNADLNTLQYCQPGVYVCALYERALTLVNSPTDTAFRMEVFNGNAGATHITTSTAWANLIRKITDIEGREYIQVIRSSGDATPVWTYRAWTPTYTTRYAIGIESDTGQTWVDGKRIYKRTIDIGRLPSTPSEKTVAHNITGMHMLVKIEASAKNSTTGVYYPLPYLYGADLTRSSDIGVSVTNTVVGVHVGSDRSDIDTCYVTVYYTKS